MDALLNRQFSWANFLIVALGLIALYFMLQFIYTRMKKANFLGKYQNPIKKIVYYILVIYEPLVILILTGAFVLIDPVYHGLLVAFLIIIGFEHIRNYMNGRIVQFDNAVALGNRLKARDLQGIISQIGRLGLKLRTNKGLHFINYSQLLSEGFLLLAGEEIGGFYQLKIKPNQPNEKTDYIIQLSDLLTTSPYLDWNHKPELTASTNEPDQINVRVSVKEESHLYDLMLLIREWGYSCVIPSK